MSLIKIDELVKRYVTYGTVTNALQGVSLEIEEGEMVAIMGPSGSGKSTMLNMLGCLDQPTSGTYFLNNLSVEDLTDSSLAYIRNRSVGFVFQQFALIDDYTVYENVELPLLYKNMYAPRKERVSKSVIRQKIYDMLTSLGIKDHAHKIPAQLSGGQQQRVAIARALIAEPEIIIADEPTGALDQKTGAEVMDLLVEINRKGKTVIIVTHDDKVASYCQRVIRLLDGQVSSDEVIGKEVS